MLYCDQIAANEADAIEAATSVLRLEPEDLRIAEQTDVDGGTKFRIEATRSRGEEAAEILQEILNTLCAGAELFFIDSLDKINLNITGDNLGLLIGKNGTTLDSLETIVSAMHNSGHRFYKPVLINPGGYRENKQKYLMTLVNKAMEAAKTTSKVSLPPMGRRDRKLVHELVNEFEDYESESVGEGDDRRIKIICNNKSEQPKAARQSGTIDLRKKT